MDKTVQGLDKVVQGLNNLFSNFLICRNFATKKNGKNKKNKQRIKAEQYYIENIEVTQAEVAELYGVRPATIGEWVKKYDWEDKRLNFHASPTIIKQKLQAETIRVMNGQEPTFWLLMWVS